MLTTPHATAGIAIGALLVNPVLVVPVAIGSHFLLDMIPHWQEQLAPYRLTKKTVIRAPLDLGLAVVLTAIAVQLHPELARAIWLGAIVANLPDLDIFVVLFPKLNQGLVRRYWDWHSMIQRETSSPWGIVPQLSVMFVCLWTVKLAS